MTTNEVLTSIDRARLTEAVTEMVNKNRKPLRVSESFIKLWCGKYQPTQALEAQLKELGLEIVPGLDSLGGWDVRLMGTTADTFDLRPCG